MNSNDIILSPTRTATVSLVLALAFAGCNTHAAPGTDDASINTGVQSRLFSDQNLGGQAIQTTVAGGVVTLNGTVTNDTQRSLASGDAAQVAGVKTVVNNLVVQSAGLQPLPASGQVAGPAPVMTGNNYRKPSASQPQYKHTEPAPIVRNNAPSQQPLPQQQNQQQTQVQPPPPPPAPVPRNITLPAGTTIPVRITQSLDSATTQTGDKFTGAIASDIISDGMVILAQGTPVTGRVDAVQEAGHYKGNSLLSISLSAIDRRGERIQVATDSFSKQGEGRGKNTAEKVGGGAAVGAILGGIFGGGKGAAIGAAAGGGVGAGANTITRGQQVQIPSETVVRFRLADAIVIRVSPNGNSFGNSGPALERRSNQ